NKLCQIDQSFSVSLDQNPDRIYPHVCHSLDFELQTNRADDLLDLELQNHRFCIRGSKAGFENLGMSLLNFFEVITVKGQHFHLDYFEGVPGLLSPTKISLVVSCADFPANAAKA